MLHSGRTCGAVVADLGDEEFQNRPAFGIGLRILHLDEHALTTDEIEIGLRLVGEELLEGSINACGGVVVVTNQIPPDSSRKNHSSPAFVGSYRSASK